MRKLLGFAGRLDWTAVVFLGGVHLATLLLAQRYFSWEAAGVGLALYFVTGVAITMFYHRLLTHRSFQTYTPVRWAGTVVGVCAMQGSPKKWIADHRKHHDESDQQGDVHSPVHGFWWSHLLWSLMKTYNVSTKAYYDQYVPDLQRERFMGVMEKTFPLILVAMFALLYGAGYQRGGHFTGMSYLVWGGFVRLVVVLHITWMVNSVSHSWGSRRYETKDQSRNNLLIAILAHGEGNHNNHHAKPTQANHGERWYEPDLTYALICLGKYMGVIWGVKSNLRWHGHARMKAA